MATIVYDSLAKFMTYRIFYNILIDAYLQNWCWSLKSYLFELGNLLGSPFLGQGVLCGYSRSGSGCDP